jgi:hypothetical protein
MKFILTRELGRLAKWLRLLGFDAVYFNQDNLSSLIIQALRDERIILTRNHKLHRRAAVKVILVQAEKIKEQVPEVLRKLDIRLSSDMMFSRCIICNEELVDIDKEQIRDRVPEYVFRTQANFIRCPQCRRIYWQGTHWGNVQAALKEITENPKLQ